MKKKIYLLSAANALLLCFSQIRGNPVPVLLCLLLLAGITGYSCVRNFALPVLLFFLPFAPLLRLSPGSISAYTLALLLTGIICVVKNRFRLKSYYAGIALTVLVVTLLSKILSGYMLKKNYLMFIAMLALYPMLDFEKRRYDFAALCLFFSSGIIVAALTAQKFADYPNIARFIKVDTYLNITRRCGYYGDPNFYTAHITAALVGSLVLLEREGSGRPRGIWAALGGLLVYCGLLSGSKSFVIIAGAEISLWTADILVSRRSLSGKLGMLAGLGIFFAFAFASSALRSLIDMVVTRFSWAGDASGFTTGRTDIWKQYVSALCSSLKLALLGQGYTDVVVGTHASHNTPIQLIYQFGILGSGLLIAWFAGFYRDIVDLRRAPEANRRIIWLLLGGAFSPWLAIDILFFDELFLISTYAFIGIQQTASAGRRRSICGAPGSEFS